MLQQSQSKYAIEEANAFVKTIEQDPLAFDYDYHYDKMQKQKEQQFQDKLAKKCDKDGVQQRPQSKYLAQMQAKNERRKIEQSAAWERMEAKQNKKDG